MALYVCRSVGKVSLKIREFKVISAKFVTFHKYMTVVGLVLLQIVCRCISGCSQDICRLFAVWDLNLDFSN